MSYTNPNMEIISPSRNVLDMGIYMSGDCTFNYHISSLSKRCANLSGWILRTCYTRDSITMLTLFQLIVLSRLDYGSQLWSPFLIKHVTQLEKIQPSFTKHITGMNDMPYNERLKSLGIDIVTTIGRGNGAMLVLLDLSAVFNTIDHLQWWHRTIKINNINIIYKV